MFYSDLERSEIIERYRLAPTSIFFLGVHGLSFEHPAIAQLACDQTLTFFV
jgi:hypothetical protein